MKKILVFFAFLSFGFILVIFGLATQKDQKFTNQSLVSPLSKIEISTSKLKKEEKSIFAPYWTLNNKSFFKDYNKIIYFSIAVNNQGIDFDDKGYKNIQSFLNLIDNKKSFLTIRMTDSDINSLVLRDNKLQKKIIEGSIDAAKENKFKGIVLDFEISALAFESVKKEINNFVKNFYNSSKKEQLDFYLTLYGDVFYRLRPYDVKALSGFSDKIMIMAYDFHKAKGNPGPNFPLFGKSKYGYDFSFMVSDFLKNVPLEKIEVIFGLFGYDWEVNEKGQSVSQASALSYLEIKKKFLDSCNFTNCKIQRDKDSSETKITYVDESGKSHIVWFEDMESVKKKIEFLKQNGLNSVSFWSYSYF